MGIQIGNQREMFFDKVCIGTAQFGMSYGISNKSGKPSCEEVFKILEDAYQKGIRFLDTAHLYGDSEVRIGKYIKESSHLFQMTSKISENLDYNSVIKKTENALKALGVDELYGLMLHDTADLKKDDVLKGLMDMKEKGIVRRIGVSVYSLEEAFEAFACNVFTLIQVPYNPVDTRFSNPKFLEICKKNDIEIHTRSGFLQGLLLMEKNAIPFKLKGVEGDIDRLDAIAQEEGLTRKELITLWILQTMWIDKWVVGINSFQELLELNQAIETKQISKDAVHRINNSFVEIDNLIIDPSKW